MTRAERLRTRVHGCVATLSVLALFAVAAVSAAEEAALWTALSSGGHVALLRHAVAPGTGDPPEFALRQCDTQRNLSAEGRAQAQRIGARFRENGIRRLRVLSSQWCRCLETARLLDLGPVEELPDLNSFYQRDERRVPQTQALQRWLAGQTLDEAVLLVTHQVNISALTDVYPASGELVVVGRSAAGKLVVVGTIETD